MNAQKIERCEQGEKQRTQAKRRKTCKQFNKLSRKHTFHICVAIQIRFIAWHCRPDCNMLIGR